MARVLEGSSRKVLIATSIASREYLRGIARRARECDWHLVTDMMFTGVPPRGWKGSGILALLPHPPDLLTHSPWPGIPCVAVTGADLPATVPRVDSDHGAIGRSAADHFLERGYRSFAWAPFLNDAANRDRLSGFQARLAEHGCECRELAPTHSRIGPYWQDNWAELRRNLLAELQRLPRPAAVLAFNDCAAANVVDVCRDAGLAVPEDVAVLGVGNSVVCETSPVPLSSVDDDPEEIGYRAAGLLESLMTGAEAPVETVRVPPKGIVTRVSTDVLAVNDPRVSRALYYIAEHYRDPMLTVSEVASAVSMSRRNLERSFRQETGRTINEHIMSIRMREASRLLKTHPRVKSADIAALVGIPGEGTFFRAFRRHFSMSPRTHRDWSAQSCVSSRPNEPELGAASNGASPTAA
ncbi:hypothetical protein DB347_07195 [Opitutaceae bacterium EW11]|nr:hypothetical protein DB347_07195 [Opitutaceae bacterium EW11]